MALKFKKINSNVEILRVVSSDPVRKLQIHEKRLGDARRLLHVPAPGNLVPSGYLLHRELLLIGHCLQRHHQRLSLQSVQHTLVHVGLHRLFDYFMAVVVPLHQQPG